MLYAIAEILVFLIVAGLLGVMLGWFLRGGSLRHERSRAWRAECEKHRRRADLAQARLEQCIRQRDEPQVFTAASGPGVPDPQQEQAAPDKASAQEKVRVIARRTAGDESVEDDDLKKVRGIGPVLENLLKGMGITSFRQIAHFTQDDIRYVAAALGSFPGRIERDNWMHSALDEYKKKYGKDLMDE